MSEIKTKKELIVYLTKLTAAYRKSYKLYGIINRVLQITGGIVGSTALLAMVPVIPVFIAAVSVVPVVIGVITGATNLDSKKNILKNMYKKFNSLISYIHTFKQDDEKLLKEIFLKINDIHNCEDYREPLELYIKKYKLNGYA